MKRAPTIDWTTLAKDSALLAALPTSARQTARVFDVPPSTRIFHRGDVPQAMLVVLGGEVRLARPSSMGHELVLQRCRHGVLAEASVDHDAYHCDAWAVVASRLLKIPRPAFRRALSDAAFQKAWTEHLTLELRRTRAQAERLTLRTAQERVVHYIECEGSRGTVVLGRSKKDWASELGLTHEALYRTLAKMERSGELKTTGTSVSLRL